MKRILNANLKKFLGAKYERIPQTFIIWAFVVFAVKSAGLSLMISPLVLWLAAAVATVGGVAQVLSADDTVESLQGQLMLPESPALFHAACCLAVTVYVMLTKTGLLLIGYLALSGFEPAAVTGFFACFIASAAAAYTFAFRTEKKTAPYRYVKNRRHNFFIYLLRYMLRNKPYLSNTVILWAFGCAFAFFTSKSGYPNVLPLGIALMCLNTPLGILLSSDRALYKQIKLLPGQTASVLTRYALFAATVNAISCGVYLTAWRLITGRLNPAITAMAVLFALISGALTVFLEMKFPLLNWKVQSDLFHHPRKYVVPGIMLLLSLPIAIFMGGI